MMIKKLVIALALAGLVFQTGCTSKDSASDTEDTAAMESADLEQLEGDEALQIAGEEGMASDQLPEDALGETNTASNSESTTTTETATTTTETTIGDDQATTEQVDVATNTETLPADPFAESAPSMDVPADTTVVDSTPAPVDAPENTAMVESTTSTTSSSTSEETTEAPKKPAASLQKIASTPWRQGKTLYNAVYFARPGDSLANISQMIYGADRTAELRRGNSAFASRDVRPGDKVYYNSPQRPDDAGRVLTYQEDNGMAPEIYVAKEGDNIRAVSKNLLQYDNAWKEVWSANMVESKGALPAGTELRYWKNGLVAAAPQAPAAPPAPTEVAQSMPEPQAPAAPPPPDFGQQAQNEIPPPPMEQPMDMTAPPPPPPMDMAQEMAPPPPPPPMESVNPPAPPQEIAAEESTGLDNDTTMALGVVGIAAAGLALMIVLRKKRKQKELEQQAMDNTHVV